MLTGMPLSVTIGSQIKLVIARSSTNSDRYLVSYPALMVWAVFEPMFATLASPART
jgi:hypothetical protein